MTKLSPTIAIIAALACAAGAYYWAHGPGAFGRVSKAAQPALAAPVLATGKAAEGSTSPTLSKTTAPGIPVVTADASTPLRPGEVLEFAADVANLSNVANLRLQIVDRRDFFGKNAWHLQAFARTENPLRMVFELDDQFDSYSDAATLLSLQYEMHLNERGEKQESIQRMTTTSTERAAANATQTRVVPGTRDPLGLMQYLRTVDWAKTHEVRVFDAGVELKDAHFALYLASNAARTPVLLEAVMPFATARLALVKIK